MMGVMSPSDGHYEAIGMKAAGEFFSASSRIEMSPKMIFVISDIFCHKCTNDAIAKGFREMATIIAKHRLAQAA